MKSMFRTLSPTHPQIESLNENNINKNSLCFLLSEQNWNLCSNNELISFTIFFYFSLEAQRNDDGVNVCDPCAVRLSTNVVAFHIFHLNCIFNQHQSRILCVATVWISGECVSADAHTKISRCETYWMNDNNNLLEQRQQRIELSMHVEVSSVCAQLLSWSAWNVRLSALGVSICRCCDWFLLILIVIFFKSFGNQVIGIFRITSNQPLILTS